MHTYMHTYLRTHIHAYLQIHMRTNVTSLSGIAAGPCRAFVTAGCPGTLAEPRGTRARGSPGKPPEKSRRTGENGSPVPPAPGVGSDAGPRSSSHCSGRGSGSSWRRSNSRRTLVVVVFVVVGVVVMCATKTSVLGSPHPFPKCAKK